MPRRKKLSPDPFEIEIDSLLENGRGAAVHGEKPLQVHAALPDVDLAVARRAP